MPESNTLDNNRPEFHGEIDVLQRFTSAASDEEIAALVGRVAAEEGFHQGEISVAIVDNAMIEQLNRQYLQHAYPTDVLSFVFDCQAQPGLLRGEIIVSAEMADQVAAELGHDPRAELLWYLIHGTLHLVGWDDQDESQRRNMRDRERHYLQQFDLPLLTDTSRLVQPVRHGPRREARLEGGGP